jgi:hypothetical protein
MTYPEQIKEIDDQIQELNAKKHNLMREWVERECPVKVGDVIESNGCGHYGKNIKVDGVQVYKFFREWRWKASGPVLKKDGTPGLNRGELDKPVEGSQ